MVSPLQSSSRCEPGTSPGAERRLYRVKGHRPSEDPKELGRPGDQRVNSQTERRPFFFSQCCSLACQPYFFTEF